MSEAASRLLRTAQSGSPEERLRAAAKLQTTCLDRRQACVEPRWGTDQVLALMAASDTSFELKKALAGCLAGLGWRWGSGEWVRRIGEEYKRGSVELRALILRSVNWELEREGKSGPGLGPEGLASLAQTVSEWLEGVETAKLLLPLVDAALAMALHHAAAFQPHFRDTTDILLGWYIEPEQTSAVRAKCEEAMRALGSYWLADLHFSLHEMLAQFLRDAQIYTKDATSGEASGSAEEETAEDALYKASLLIRATRLIFDSLSVPASSPHWAEVKAFAEEALGCLDATLRQTALGKRWDEGSDLLSQALPLVARLQPFLGPEKADVRQRWLSLCLHCLAAAARLKSKAVREAVQATGEMVERTPAESLPSLAEGLIGPSSPLRALRFRSSAPVAEAVLGVYRAFLVPHSIRSLTATFTLVTNEMRQALHFLRGDQNLSESGATDFAMGSREEATAILVFHSAALAGLAVSKNSLIAMWSLSPNLWDFVGWETGLGEEWLGARAPAAHYALLHLLRGHADAHELFLPTSALCQTPAANGPTPSFRTASQSAAYLQRLLALLSRVLRLHSLPEQSRRLSLHWIKDLSQTAAKTSSFRPLLASEDFQGAVAAAVELLPRVQGRQGAEEATELVNTTLREMISPLGEALGETIVATLGQLRERTKATWALVDRTPLAQVTTVGESRGGEASSLLQWEGTLSSAAFTQLSGYLFRKRDGELAREAMTALVAEQRALLPDSTGSLWDWLLFQTAGYCVTNKLRTPQGKAVDTFLMMENEVKLLATETLKGRPRNGAKAQSDAPAAPLSAAQAFHRVRSLLLFMEVLDKAMYNAYAGTAFALRPPSKAARSFFHNNRKTCTDWMGRLRVALLTVALHNGLPTMALRLASQHLEELSAAKAPQLSPNTLLLLYLTAQALLDMGAWRELEGLDSLLKTSFATALPYLPPAALIAKGHLEPAQKLLRQEVAQMPPQAAPSPSPLPNTQTILCRLLLRTQVQGRAWESLRSGGTEEWALLSEAEPTSATYLARLSKWEPVTGEGETRAVSWDWSEQLRRFQLRLNEASVGKGSSAEVLREMEELSEKSRQLRWDGSLEPRLEFLRRVGGHLVKSRAPASLALSGCHDFDLHALHSDWISRLNYQPENLQLSKLLRKRENFAASGLVLLKELGKGGSGADGWDKRLQENWASEQGRETEPWKWLGLGRAAGKLLRCVGLEGGKAESRRQGFGLLVEGVTGVLDGAMGSVVAQAPEQTLLSAVCERLAALREAGKMGGAAGGVREELCRAMLDLSTWLASEPSLGDLLLLRENSIFIKLIEEQLSITENYLGALDSGSIVGALLTLGASVCPSLSKGQGRFADWAYKAGRMSVEDGEGTERVLLTAQEVASVRELVSGEELETAMELVSTLHPGEEGGAPTEEAVFGLVGARLRSVGEEGARKLAGLWSQAQRRLFLFYSSAAQAYLAYLGLSGERESATTMRGTLRLLRLLVRHGEQLSDVLGPGIQASDAALWRRVLPQLLARLRHPSKGVRSVLSQLLSRITRLGDASVAVPLIVAAEEAPDGVEAQLLKDLAQQQPQLVQQLSVFVSQLHRISLLRDEKLHFVLSHLQLELNRRLRRLEEEETLLAGNERLSGAQRSRISGGMARLQADLVFNLVRDLLEEVMEKAETRQDKEFLSLYAASLGKVSAAVQAVLSPSAQLSSGQLRKAWSPCQELLALLTQRLGRSLDLRSLSPQLAQLQGSSVPLFGTELTLHSIRPSVLTLPSKTRPKKLTMVGSDGKCYAYLLKGQEDLHLDERIMQLLRVVNLELGPKKGRPLRFVARHYDVTPLGTRSGLIQWVHGPVPVFSVYRRWQLREAARTSATPLKPNDLFHAHVAKALDAKASDAPSRAKWTPEMLEGVLKALMEETPSDLLSKELWCGSGSPEAWWAQTGKLSRSLAVMSMVGHVLGLGDRHLDNLLLDTESGEVVHIDYNVCFEKGRQLRVPETVPFRLTRNLVSALGLGGVGGEFGSSCAEVLAVLRQGRETLLTLLQTFVYDPLVDWSQDTDKSDAGFTLPHNLTLSVRSRAEGKSEEARAKEFLRIRREELGEVWKETGEEVEKRLEGLVETARGLGPAEAEVLRFTSLGAELRAELERRAAGLAPQASLLPPLTDEELSNAVSKSYAQVLQYQEQMRSALEGPLAAVRSAVAAQHSLFQLLRPALKALGRTAGPDSPFRDSLGIHKAWTDRLLAGLASGSAGETDNVASLALADLSRLQAVLHAEEEAGPAEAAAEAEGGGWEKRSEQGVWIWGRVRGKLEGREGTEVLSPADQAAKVIAEATELRNLALMYEGWTAWV